MTEHQRERLLITLAADVAADVTVLDDDAARTGRQLDELCSRARG